MPLLWIRFTGKDQEGTAFRDQSLLPLTTHCGQGLSLEARQNRAPKSSWEQNLMKEYLGQRLYKLFTGASLRSRLVRIHYPDPDKPRNVINNYAFFTEHFDTMAARNHAQRLERGSFDHELLDTGAADMLALFQYMIGNTDWSIVRQRNTVLILDESGRQVPVPYDLDMSGLVNAHYAGPPPGLPIDKVTQRHYLGFCHPGMNWEPLFQSFLAYQDEILSLPATIQGMSEKSVDETRNFLADFFEEIQSETERDKAIVNACKPWPPSSVDHTTPLGRR